MSHTVTVKTDVRSKQAIAAACHRLGLAAPVDGKHTLFQRNEKINGTAVQFPNWQYPVIFNTETGEVAYDNFNGNWGNIAEYDKFMQSYAICRTMQEASLQGYMATEETLADGSVKITVNVEN
jgi:hypothetical protein